MGKSKIRRGLCDANKCYNPAAVVWTTGGEVKIMVCAEHDKSAKEQMGSQYKRMKPTRIKNLPCLTCETVPCVRKLMNLKAGCQKIGEQPFGWTIGIAVVMF